MGTDFDGVTVGDAVAVGETDKALKVDLEGEIIWVPKSQIHDDSEVYEPGTDGTLIVTRWFADQRGWG